MMGLVGGERRPQLSGPALQNPRCREAVESDYETLKACRRRTQRRTGVAEALALCAELED